ncbi:enoyl-CoA delta isomerase 2, peroxisomal-like [Heracleum sosnowskyi]|uniref:Delta(3)-Delta(2)-enoyl-CoA isomerase n=1 Tax=Heracleum sosnowskyi TaxID=360622 RepID=A0AAD8MKU1_9APIA|nr:enoyl-CoA delta isomerase 2, peroxisomal-like [Heracleum sosnowskyi]
MCTLEKRGNIFVLTLTGDDQHRLNPTLISTLRSHLSQIKAQSTRGSALVTLAEGKFFSNGFDLDWAQKNSRSADEARAKLVEMVELFRPVVKDLIALPMPTIGAITGHAAAAGLVLALSHDHVFMRRDRGVMYMSEVDIGLTFPDYFSVFFRSKVASPAARRDLLLNGMKLKAEDAVAMGIIDSAYDDAEKTVDAAVQLAEKLGKRKWDGVVYGEIRKSLLPELCDIVGLVGAGVATSRL